MYTSKGSNPFTEFVAWVSDQLSLQVEHITVENKDDFKDKLPHGKFPSLELEDGNILMESGAIARHLCRLVPGVKLYGHSTYETSLIDQWLDYSSTLGEKIRAVVIPIIGMMPAHPH